MSRIAFIDLLFNWPPDGGARVDLKEIMTRLSRRHEVILIVPDFRDYFPRGRISGEFPFRIVHLPFGKLSFNAWHLPRLFRKTVESLGPDRIFIGDGWYLKFPLAAALADYSPIVRLYAYEGLCITHYGTQYVSGDVCPANLIENRRECIRCALRHHRFHPLDAFSHEFLSAVAFTPLYARWVRAALRSASALIVYNSYMRDSLSPYNENVIVAPSGVDPAAYAGLKLLKERDRSALLVTSRSGDPAKGFKVLLEAARILKARGRNFELIVPTYSRTDASDDFVRLFGWKPQEKLPELYGQADICVVPSVWREPFGIAAVEAMAAGRPVVASASGGLRDIVEDGVTGFLVEPGDARALAMRIETLMRDPALRRLMGRAGRARVEERFSWDVIMKKIYFPLLGEPDI